MTCATIYISRIQGMFIELNPSRISASISTIVANSFWIPIDVSTNSIDEVISDTLTPLLISKNPRITFHAYGSVREFEGMNPHISKWAPTFKVRVLMDFQIFKE